MTEFFETIKKRGIEWFINSRLSRLAQTKNESEFHEVFDQILKEMENRAGPNKKAVRVMRKAVEMRHPLVKIVMYLLQENRFGTGKKSRLSKQTRERLAGNFFVNWVMESDKRDKIKQEGFKAPWFFVISPTNACNLDCYGCYAHEYKKGQRMSFETFDRILREAKELGIRFLTISGGEPFFWRDRETGKDLLDLAEKHNDLFFQVYTNGTLLDDKKIERLSKLGNVAPSISQEGMKKETDERRGKGTWEKICEVREKLYQQGILQGFSITVTRENAEVVSSDEFIDNLIEQEVSFGWFFIYIPIGKKPAVELMPLFSQRIHLREKVWRWRTSKPIFIGDFWDDGPWVGGCIACGRKYFHINSQGDVEPCVFFHFASDNIYDLWRQGKGLKEAITSDFFRDLRERQLGIDNWLAPCCIIDNPEIQRETVNKNNVYPTHTGAETITQGKIAEYLDRYSKQFRGLTRPEFEKMMAGKYDTKVVKLSEVIEKHLQRNKREVKLLMGR